MDGNTWLCEEIVRVDDDGFLTQFFSDQLKHLVELLETDFLSIKMVPSCKRKQTILCDCL